MVATTTQSQTNSSGKSVAATNLANKSDILTLLAIDDDIIVDTLSTKKHTPRT